MREVGGGGGGGGGGREGREGGGWIRKVNAPYVCQPITFPRNNNGDNQGKGEGNVTSPPSTRPNRIFINQPSSIFPVLRALSSTLTAKFISRPQWIKRQSRFNLHPTASKAKMMERSLKWVKVWRVDARGGGTARVHMDTANS